MILKYALLIIFAIFLVTASDPHFGIELGFKAPPDEKKEDVREMAWMSTNAFRTFLNDDDDRVSDLFPVTDYYYPTVNFWFMIYTQFESSQVVIHDKVNLNLIYKVLDFSSLHHKGLNSNILYVVQQKLSEDKINELKEDLKYLADHPFSLEPRAKAIYRMLKEANVSIPIKKLDRQAFFNSLKDNIRSQTGQRNFIKAGIKRSLPYKPFLNKFFKERGLPIELLAVPFLESSFNPLAESRVGAMGAWQFMPLIASHYVPKRSVKPPYDYRSNIGVISVAASFLMMENFRIMKSWDLAVTAYNSGTKHLLKTKRELASTMDEIDLEDIIKHSDSAHFGFASKNFYSEFLALVHALAYEEEIFAGLHHEDRYNVNDMLEFYLAKCSVRLDKVLNQTQLDDVIYYNHHIRKLQATYPRGTIITSKEPLPASRFYKMKFNDMVKVKPKDWVRFLKNQSCSTR